MKSIINLQFIIIAVFSLFLSGCANDDNLRPDRFWVSYGEVIIDGDSCTINIDDGKLLYITESIVPLHQIIDKQCVVANYTILKILPEGYNVRLNALSDVPVKEPLHKSQLTESEYEECGDNFLALTRKPWFSLGKYITVAFETLYDSSRIHPELNLVIDEDNSTADEIFAELKYESASEFHFQRGSGIISFKAIDLIPSDKNGIKVIVKWKDICGEESSQTLDITRDTRHI